MHAIPEDVQDDQDVQPAITVRKILSLAGALLVPVAMLIWVHVNRRGDRALPYYPIGTSSAWFIFYRLSQAIVTWAPLACVFSIFAAASVMGKRRDGWFRQAYLIAAVVVVCFFFWAIVGLLVGNPSAFYFL